MVALLLIFTLFVLVIGSNGQRESKSNGDELMELHFCMDNKRVTIALWRKINGFNERKDENYRGLASTVVNYVRMRVEET
jgi:hypothetical protein